VKTQKPAFNVFGVPVFLPPSAAFGVVLISYFALPSSSAALNSTTNDLPTLGLALLHGLLLYSVILIHEIGHVVAAKQYGYPVINVVLHIIGGHTAFKNRFTRPRHQFVVAISGPLVTFIPGLAALSILQFSPGPAVQSLAEWTLWASVIGGIVNLLPGLPLDGGAALSAIVWRIKADPLKGQFAAAYGGLFVSSLWVVFPYIAGAVLGFVPGWSDLLLAWFIGSWLAFQAWAQIQSLKRVKRSGGTVLEPAVQTEWQLKVRRAIGLDSTISLNTAIELMENSKAGAVLLLKDDSVYALVLEEFLSLATNLPTTQNQDGSAQALAASRRIFDYDFIPRDISYEDFAKLLETSTSQEWVVLDSSGKIYGVAYRKDQDRA
jgi:Zn-dependent protease